MIPESRRSRAAAPRQERSKNIITRQECGPRLSPIACTRGRGHQTSVQSKNIIVVIKQGLQALDRPRSPALLAAAIRQGLQLSAATRHECCAAKTSSRPSDKGLSRGRRPRSMRQGLQLSAVTRHECCAAKTSSWPESSDKSVPPITGDRLRLCAGWLVRP